MDHHDHWLVSFFLAVAGIYVLFAALALAELASARWGIWLVFGAVALFAAALSLGAGGLRRIIKS
jgi:hypothetical protein